MAEGFSLTPQQLLPQRSPKFIDRVARVLFKNDPAMGPQPRQQESTQSGVVAQALESIYDQYFKSLNERQAIYKDVDEMDAASEEASVALDTIADNVTTSEDGLWASFQVYSENEPLQSYLDKVCKDTDLYHKIYSFTRSAVKYGDMFLEIVANGEADIVDVRMLPPQTMFRNQDAKGNLIIGRPKYDDQGVCRNANHECAFEQRELDTGDIMAAFWPWQIVHGRWNHDGWSPYGRSYLRVSRIIWKKMKAEEEALIMGRLVRAMLKLAFYVDTTGLSAPQKEDALKNFRNNVTNRQTIDGKRENPFYVLTDFFVSVEHYKLGGQVHESLTKIEAIDPKNDGLTQIDDIKHFHRKFLATLRVPPAYYGFEEDSPGGDAVSMQDIEYIRFLRRIQQFMGQCVRQIFDTALVLGGYDLQDENNAYDIKWPPLSTADEAASADAFYKQAQGWALLLGTSSQNQTPVIDPVYIQKHGLNLSDEEIEELSGRLDELRDKRLEEMKAMAAQEQAVEAAGKPSAPNQSNTHNHTERNSPTRNANGANTQSRSVRQEVNSVVTSLKTKLKERLDPEFERLTLEQDEAVEELAGLFPSGTNGATNPSA